MGNRRRARQQAAADQAAVESSLGAAVAEAMSAAVAFAQAEANAGAQQLLDAGCLTTASVTATKHPGGAVTLGFGDVSARVVCEAPGDPRQLAAATRFALLTLDAVFCVPGGWPHLVLSAGRWTFYVTAYAVDVT